MNLEKKPLEENSINKKFLKSIADPVEKLKYIHNNVLIQYGKFKDEYPEQLLSVKFIKSDARVLELGSNVGRNSLVIATILDNDKNLVTLETSPTIYKNLVSNRDINKYKFHTENSALSYKNLIQKNWNTIPSDVLLPGYEFVKIITFEELEKKYKIKFDTLVVDCEGALYYILLDNDKILNDIHTIIIENDFSDIKQKTEVDEIFSQKGFKRIYVQPLTLNVKMPCKEIFYEVWTK